MPSISTDAYVCFDVCTRTTLHTGALTTASVFGDRSILVILNGVVCTGAEANLIGCIHGDIAQHSCSATLAGAICLVGKYKESGIRIEEQGRGGGGTREGEGREG